MPNIAQSKVCIELSAMWCLLSPKNTATEVPEVADSAALMA